jgi:hypothetical protein
VRGDYIRKAPKNVKFLSRQKRHADGEREKSGTHAFSPRGDKSRRII